MQMVLNWILTNAVVNKNYLKIYICDNKPIRMKKKYILFSLIENMKLLENQSFILFGWTFTNDHKKIVKAVPNPQSFFPSIGASASIEFQTKVVAFKEYECDESTISFKLHEEVGFLNAILSTIWLVNDNAVFGSGGFALNVENDSLLTNKFSNFISDSRGEYTPFNVESDLIDQIVNAGLWDKMKILIYTEERDPGIDENITSAEINKIWKASIENKLFVFTRIQRSFLLLNIARTNSFLPLKIGFYVNALECLLITTESELSFRLQLYLANFIGEDKNEKEYIMSIVKQAYDVRSKLFHGGIIKQKTDNYLSDLSQNIDNLLRKAINKSTSMVDIINDNNNLDKLCKTNLFN